MEKLNNVGVTVLIPTMNKQTPQEIIFLCEKMKIESNAVVANQCGKNDEYLIEYKNHQVLVICTDTIGVSKNRNILLENAFGKYCVFMDDDGQMEDGYNEVIVDGFQKFNCEWIKFNVMVNEQGNRETNTLCNHEGVAKYRHISQYGMPGFAFDKTKFDKALHFDESVGVPNYIFHGEDSLFIHNLYKRCKIFCSKRIIASINQEESTWFDKYDNQYYVTQGYLYRKMHKKLSWLFILRMYFKKRHLFNVKYNFVRKRAKIGCKICDKKIESQRDFAERELLKI